jgi:hypothetical protein
MPRYFLNMRVADEWAPDPEGADLPDLAAAKAQALDLIFFTASDHLRTRRRMDIESIEITDGDGALLAAVTVQDALRREGEPEIRRYAWRYRVQKIWNSSGYCSHTSSSLFS